MIRSPSVMSHLRTDHSTAAVGFHSRPPVGLECILQSELEIPRPLRRIHYTHQRTGENIDLVTLNRENRSVEGIDRFSPELHVLTFGEQEPLGEAEIHLLQSRTPLRAHTAGAKVPGSRIAH